MNQHRWDLSASLLNVKRNCRQIRKFPFASQLLLILSTRVLAQDLHTNFRIVSFRRHYYYLMELSCVSLQYGFVCLYKLSTEIHCQFYLKGQTCWSTYITYATLIHTCLFMLIYITTHARQFHNKQFTLQAG